MALNNIGGIWNKVDKRGRPYWSLTVELEGKKHHVKVFQNEKKTEKHPDYSICLDVDDDEGKGSWRDLATKDRSKPYVENGDNPF